MHCKDKLKPFLDEGFVHTDRKPSKKAKDDQDEEESNKNDIELEARIWEYKERVMEAIADK